MRSIRQTPAPHLDADGPKHAVRFAVAARHVASRQESGWAIPEPHRERVARSPSARHRPTSVVGSSRCPATRRRYVGKTSIAITERDHLGPSATDLDTGAGLRSAPSRPWPRAGHRSSGPGRAGACCTRDHRSPRPSVRTTVVEAGRSARRARPRDSPEVAREERLQSPVGRVQVALREADLDRQLPELLPPSRRRRGQHLWQRVPPVAIERRLDAAPQQPRAR